MLCIFLALFVGRSSFAQHSVGVDWDTPDDLRQFQKDLEFFKNHNISFLILDHSLIQEEIEYLDRFEIPYIVRLNNRFISNSQFKTDSVLIVKSIQSSSIAYDSSSTFEGILGISDSDVIPFTLDDKFNLFFELNDTLKSKYSIIDQAYFFRSEKATAESIHDFKNRLSEYPILIVKSEWLYEIFEEFPELQYSFSNDIDLTPQLIPLPELTKELPIIHWSILVLFFLWLSLGINVGTNPTYLETIPRYFIAHRFFVDDIMSYRERSSKSAVFLMFQHALFGGLVVYILAKIFVSTIGLEALYYHLPYIAIMGQNYFSLFVLTSIIVFLVELIAVFWLYLPNNEMSHFNQPLNLFTWIFHLDFIVGTLIVTAYFADLGASIIVFLSIVYLVIWFSSFNITALGASKKLGMVRNSYLFKTIGLHTLASILLLIVLIYFDGWLDLLQLVVSI